MTESRGKPIVRMVFEVVLISIGVFLGLAGDQWREDVRDYHVATLERIRAYLATDPQKRNRADIRLQGLRPATFEQTAWDLALSTQSLTYIDPDLAFALSKVYNNQQQYIGLTRGITQAMYLLPLKENFDAFVAAADTYFSDVVLMEPKLLEMYDEVIQLIDRELER